MTAPFTHFQRTFVGSLGLSKMWFHPCAMSRNPFPSIRLPLLLREMKKSDILNEYEVPVVVVVVVVVVVIVVVVFVIILVKVPITSRYFFRLMQQLSFHVSS